MISFGWPGDDTLGDAAYYSYTAPEPQGLRDQPLPIGSWIESGAGSLASPPTNVRTALDPRTTLLAFCQSRRDRRAPRRLGHDQLRIEMVPTRCSSNNLQAVAAADFGRPIAPS